MMIKDVIVFDRRKFDSVITNTNFSLIKILENSPVVLNISGKYECVGFITNVREIELNVMIGDIYIYPICISEYFKYEVESQELLVSRIDRGIVNKITITDIITYIKNISF